MGDWGRSSHTWLWIPRSCSSCGWGEQTNLSPLGSVMTTLKMKPTSHHWLDHTEPPGGGCTHTSLLAAFTIACHSFELTRARRLVSEPTVSTLDCTSKCVCGSPGLLSPRNRCIQTGFWAGAKKQANKTIILLTFTEFFPEAKCLAGTKHSVCVAVAPREATGDKKVTRPSSPGASRLQAGWSQVRDPQLPPFLKTDRLSWLLKAADTNRRGSTVRVGGPPLTLGAWASQPP